MTKRRARPVIVFAFAAGLVVFALSAHRPSLLAPRIFGIAVAGVALLLGVKWSSQPGKMLGLSKFPKKRLIFLPIAIGLGAGLGMYYRSLLGLTLLPGDLKKFCILAGYIGLCEELAYRGFLQGLLGKYGPFFACTLAALAHTAYKCSLFVFPNVPVRANLLFLGVGTFVAGLIFGLMREKLTSVIFPIVAHVTFDVVTYGNLSEAPWWVW